MSRLRRRLESLEALAPRPGPQRARAQVPPRVVAFIRRMQQDGRLSLTPEVEAGLQRLEALYGLGESAPHDEA